MNKYKQIFKITDKNNIQYVLKIITGMFSLK